MILSLAITVALLFLSFSNALSLDSSVHLARHQQIAARHPVVERSVSGRCKAPHASVASKTAKSPQSTSAPAPVSSSTEKSLKFTTAPPSDSSSQKKVGLGWFQDPNDPNLVDFITPKVSAIYTWSPTSPPDRHNLQFCAMLWGRNKVQEFQSVVKAGYADCLIGYNEPNLSSQSSIPPEEAAQIWMNVGDPLKNQGYSTIVTPAVTSAPDGVQWLQEFFKACTGCRFTAMALHYYGTNSQGMIDYLTRMHKTFNMDIWVTEFAAEDFTGGPQSDEEQITAFMRNITTWMDQTPFIRKYFPYGLTTAANININKLAALAGPDDKPNALGCLALGCSG